MVFPMTSQSVSFVWWQQIVWCCFKDGEAMRLLLSGPLFGRNLGYCVVEDLCCQCDGRDANYFSFFGLFGFVLGPLLALGTLI